MITFNFNIADTPTDADSVVFASPDEDFGIREVESGDVVLVGGTPLERVGLGQYQYDETDLDLPGGIEYEYFIKVTYDNEVNYYHVTFTSTGDPHVQKILRFCIIKDDLFQLLQVAPTLSSPTGSYGAINTSNNEIIAEDGTAFNVRGSLYSLTLEVPSVSDVIRYYIKCTVDGVIYFVARNTIMSTSSFLAVGRYTDSASVDKKFGFDNIMQWLALDTGDEATDYAQRAYDCIKQAEAWIDVQLSGSFYNSTSYERPTVPTVLHELATTQAGILMYESKGVTDYDPESGRPTHRLEYHRKRVEMMVKELRNGLIKLDGGLTPSQIPLANVTGTVQKIC